MTTLNAPSSGIAHPRSFFINGTWIEPSGDAVFTLSKAHTEEPYAQVAEAQAADAGRAIDAARRAFDQGPWPQMSHVERAGYLRGVAAAIREQAAAFAEAWTLETGVIQTMARQGSAAGADRFDFYADLAETFNFVEPHTPSAGSGAGYLVREPVGVVLAIIPWNAPLTSLSVKLAPALIAGCTTILKCSPEAPLEGLLFAQACERAGLPSGVVNVVTADRAVSELMVGNAAVDKVSFTGSSAAGRRIAAICGERIARYTLELGGKSAAIVREDYDIEAVAKALAASTPRISGQVCAALTRVVVPRTRHDALAQAMAAAFKDIRIGDPFSSDTDLGPLAMGRQLERVQGYIDTGVAEGATLATGGGRPPELNRGHFIEPTLFADVNNTMRIAREEVFGPVVCLIPVDGDDEAIAIANDSEFGLNSAVFTHDLDAAWAMARRIRAGTVGHNGFRLDMNMAFGGFKQSGVGREGGVEGLLPYLETKTVLLSGAPSAALQLKVIPAEPPNT